MARSGRWLLAFFDVDRDRLERLPEYRSDAEVARLVDDALRADEVLRRVSLPSIRADVEAGVVTLRGHVASRLHRARAEEAVGRVPGVRAVDDELVADDDLEVRVAQALAQDPRTRDLFVRVRASQGVVYLLGSVPSVAEEVATGVPEVRAVVKAPVGPEPDVALPRVLLPRIGVPVYATDGQLGRLERVVIDPRTRRVTHLVVAVRFPLVVPRVDEPDDGTAPVQRLLLVPAGALRHASEDVVLIKVSLAYASRLPEYAEPWHVVPDAGWQPPFDYRREDVRFAREVGLANQAVPELLHPGLVAA